MVYIKVEKDETFEQALKRFMSELKEANLQEELFKRRFYEKPTTKKRQRKKERDLKIKIAMRNS